MNKEKINAFVDKYTPAVVSGLWFVSPIMILKTRKSNRLVGDILAGCWLFGTYGVGREAIKKTKAKNPDAKIDLEKTVENIQSHIEKLRNIIDEETKNDE